jgi:hypothetical protein
MLAVPWRLSTKLIFSFLPKRHVRHCHEDTTRVRVNWAAHVAGLLPELPIWMASHEPGQNAPWSVSQHSKGFSLEGPVLCLLSLLFSSLRSNRACQAAGLRLALCQSRQGLPSPFAEGHGHRARSTAVAPAREQEARW